MVCWEWGVWGTRGNLAWGPGEGAAAEEVDVEMGNGFAAVGAVVDDKAVACGGYVFAAGDVGGGEEEAAEKRLIIGFGGSDSRDVLFRNDENMDRSLRRDVAEGEALIVLEDDVGWYFAGDDFFEEGHASWRLSSWARWLDAASERIKETISLMRPEQSGLQCFAQRRSLTQSWRP